MNEVIAKEIEYCLEIIESMNEPARISLDYDKGDDLRGALLQMKDNIDLALGMLKDEGYGK